MEVYFWSLIVAVSIFGIGGGMSIYEGITHIQHPVPLEDPTINYVVLALAMASRAISFSVAWRVFRKTKASRRRSSAIHHGKDPSLFTVLFEDTAALLGLVVAFIGIFLSHQLEEPVIDGITSVVIGGILVVAALWLAYESRSLLVGEAADPELVADIREIVLADPAVTGLGAVLTMHLGPDDVLLNIEVQFTPGLPAEDVHDCRPPHRGAHRRLVSRGEPYLHRGGGRAPSRRCSSLEDRVTTRSQSREDDHQARCCPWRSAVMIGFVAIVLALVWSSDWFASPTRAASRRSDQQNGLSWRPSADGAGLHCVVLPSLHPRPSPPKRTEPIHVTAELAPRTWRPFGSPVRRPMPKAAAVLAALIYL